MKKHFFAIFIASLYVSYADTIKFSAMIVDGSTKKPMPNVKVCAGFTMDAGLVWNNRFKHEHKQYLTDVHGSCRISGESNCGKAGCYIDIPPEGYYKPLSGFSLRYKKESLFGVWQPDNLVVTILLQRVEHPIPLYVSKVHTHDIESYYDKPDSLKELRFDFVAGDWLPPLGIGKNADMIIRTEFRLNETISNMVFKALTYYDFINTIEFPGAGNGILEKSVEGNLGLKIRIADATGYAPNKILCFGRRQKKNAVIKGVCPEEYTESDPKRCYCFRVRSQFDEKGNMISAIYGKIYGDFKFDGFDKKGLTGIEFLYYLNPTPLDRNLEWDMKTNLCPTQERISNPQP